MAAGRPEGDGCLAFEEGVVVHDALHVHPGDQHRVAVQVVDDGKQREVLLMLDNAEPEAVPLQRIGRRENQVAPFGLRQNAMLFRDKADIPGVLDGVTNHILFVFVVKPAVVSPMPLKVRVDHVGKGADIAAAGYVPGAHDGPRIIEPALLELDISTKMADLHGAGRHWAYRSLAGFR